MCGKVRIFLTQTRIYWTEVFLYRIAQNISMPWFPLAHVLAAGTRQSTTPSWLLWMFNFQNCADQSLDRRQKSIGVKLGKKLLIYGMSGSEVLFQMHTLIHGLISRAKISGIWQSMLLLYLHIGGFNDCSRGIFLVLVAWAIHDISGNQNFMHIGILQLCKSNPGSWKETALDDVVWNPHVGSFANFCCM